MKRMSLLALAAIAASTAVTFGAPAQALTCYTVKFDHTPNVWTQAVPPSVTVDNGNPHAESYPC
jgi:hypothetical protein